MLGYDMVREPVDNPTTSRADAAYDRALAAYQEKSYEVARRWVLEALAHNRQHANAKALLARLDATRRATSPFETPPFGSEVVSTDPTVLVTRGSRSAPPATEPIEPTVMIRRDDPPRRAPDPDTQPVRIPASSSSRPVAEPTVIARPTNRSSSSRPKSSFSLGAAVQSLGEKLQRRKTQTTRTTSTRGPLTSSPAFRGAVIALAAIAVGALLLWGAIGAFRWFFPAGQVLTINKPANGTINGPGVECGSRGDDCVITFKTGEPVELTAEPDKGYTWSGFTGDCAPTGRLSMTGPHTCGATFEQVASAVPSVTFKLTITKPEGGTVIAAGGILCGTLGSTCSAEIPSGQPVTLTTRADEGFVWEQFTGDCPSTGETTMTSTKTCGAVFTKTTTPMANREPVRPTVTPPPLKPRPQVTPQPVTSNTPGPGPTGNNPGTGGQPTGNNPNPPAPPPSSGDSQPPSVDGKVDAPKTALEHAKDEIKSLVTNYCDQLQTLKPEKIRPLFNLDNQRELKAQFKEYKSLTCAVTSPPEFVSIDPSTAGVARVKFGMKQTVQMKSGGAPDAYETIVTMILSRKDFQSPWLIDRVEHAPKPKS